jgi:hypothetical protein
VKTQAENERNATCDICGYVYKHYQLRKRWDGYMVCDRDWETRHPMDFQRVPRTEKSPKWTRPEPADVETSPDYISSSVGTQETTKPSGHNHGDL